MRNLPLTKLVIANIAIISLFLIESPGAAYETVTVVDGGEVSGIIKLKKAPTKIPPHKVEIDPEFCGSEAMDETFVFDPVSRKVANVVASIKGIKRGKNPNPVKLKIDIKNCHFASHVQAVAAGGSYVVRNLDPVLHNIHLTVDKLTIFNVIMPPNGRNIEKPMPNNDLIHGRCDRHKFMNTSIRVFNHPYFSVSNRDGRYKISDIPPGRYTLEFWHEKLGQLEKEIIVEENKAITLNVEW